MNRRTLLVCLGTTFTGATVGCIEDGSLSPGTGGDNEINGGVNIEIEELPQSAYPDLGDDVDQTVVYDAVDQHRTDIYLEPSLRTITLEDSIDFTLENGSDLIFITSFWGWQIHKEVDGTWFWIPTESLDEAMELHPGNAHIWTVEPTNEGIPDGKPVHPYTGTTTLPISGLGGGRYSFSIDGWFEDDSHENTMAEANHENKMAFLARFELDADQLVLTPTNAIDTIEWDGETLVGFAERRISGEEYPLRVLELTRVTGPLGNADRFITEQVLRNHRLRDALALACEYEAEVVRIEERNNWGMNFSLRDVDVFEYQGEFFEVATREIEA